MGDLRIVHLPDVGRDVAVAHPEAVEAYDLLREVVRQNGLALFDEFRFKAALTVLGRLDVEGAETAL